MTEENTMPTTATAATARRAQTRPRVNERRKFMDPAKARLTVVLRRFRHGFLTYVEHKEAGREAERKRGMFKQHDTEPSARAEFERQCAAATHDGWLERGAVPESDFAALPQPASAPAARPVAARGGRRRAS